MIEDPKLSHFELRFLMWLMNEVSPVTCRLDGQTITGLAEHHRVGRKTMLWTLEKLRDERYIDFHFERRTKGWIEHRSYDWIIRGSDWLAEQRRKATNRESQDNRVEPTRQLAVNASNGRDSPGKTQKGSMTLMGQPERAQNPSRDGPNDNEATKGGDGSAVEVAEPRTSSMKGSSSGSHPVSPPVGRGLGGGAATPPRTPPSRNDTQQVVSNHPTSERVARARSLCESCHTPLTRPNDITTGRCIPCRHTALEANR